MALLFIEGFEQYDDDAEQRRGGWNFDNDAYVTQSTAGRDGVGRAMQMVFTNGFASHAVPPTTASFVVGFAYRLVNAGPQLVDIFNTFGVGVEKITLRTNASGEISIDRGSTQLGISSGLGLAMSTWYYIEVDVTLHDSTGTYDVYVDGQNVITGTSADTLNGTDAFIDTIRFFGHSFTDALVDDVYVLDDSGSDNTARLGDVFVETLLPDADGATNNFTAVGAGSTNADRVDEMAPPDDDTTYVHSATATNKDLYGFAALAGASIGDVFGVQVSLLARKEEAGFREIATVARSNVTEVDSANLSLGVDYHYKEAMYENDPNGGINWTETSVNAAQFGIKLVT